MRAVALCAALLLGACDLESPQDKAARAQLTGAWTRSERTGEQPVRLSVQLAADGTFTFKIDGPNGAETRAGRWYVTEGYYKLKYDTIDGKPLSSSRIAYFTCRLLKLDAAQFTCVDDIEKAEYTWARADSR